MAEKLLRGGDYGELYKLHYRRYPTAGYGTHFALWAEGKIEGRNESYGNGSAMRAAPVGWAFDDAEAAMAEAEASALPSHAHPEGIKGAQAIAVAVLTARKTHDKAAVYREVTGRFGYDLSTPPEAMANRYRISDYTCQVTVPQAILAFLHSESFESTVRTAVSFGGDTDTLACMAG